jgi:AraC-like DNA-binding protein
MSLPTLKQASPNQAVSNEIILKHTVLRPSEPLQPFVKRFEVVHSFTERVHTLLPDTSLVACFRLDGVARLHGASVLPAAILSSAILSGMQDGVRAVTHRAGSEVLLTVFTEAGAAAFLREPLDQLFNQTLPADCLLQGQGLDYLMERMMETWDNVRRIDLLQRFLLGRLRVEAPDRVAQAVAAHIRRSYGAVRMERLANAVGLSVSALERRFRRNVGTSPRKFASIVRLRHVLRLRKAGCNLTEIAHRAGYFDQPHFIKDFKGFTGLAPEAFFAQHSSSC